MYTWQNINHIAFISSAFLLQFHKVFLITLDSVISCSPKERNWYGSSERINEAIDMQIKINAHNHDEIQHLCLFLRNSESIFIIPPIPISEFQTVSASRHGFAIWLFIQNGTVLLIWISFSTYQFYVPPTLNIFLSKCNVMKTNISRTLFSW